METIPIELAAPRVRRALRTRSGKAWTVQRLRQGRTVVGIWVSVSARYGDPRKMTDEQRTELAKLLDYPIAAIGPGGVEFTNEQLRVLVGKAERGLVGN